MDPNDHTFAIGVISGTIGSVLAALVLFLLGRAFKPVWAKINAPSPLNLEAKVRIAQTLENQREAMKRLNHMVANPKDLYLYLFQISVVSYLLIAGGLFFLFFASSYPDLKLLPFLGILFPSCGLVFGVAAIFEADRMSAKNIDKTRTKLQASIDDATAKLGLPSTTANPEQKTF